MTSFYILSLFDATGEKRVPRLRRTSKQAQQIALVEHIDQSIRSADENLETTRPKAPHVTATCGPPNSSPQLASGAPACGHPTITAERATRSSGQTQS